MILFIQDNISDPSGNDGKMLTPPEGVIGNVGKVIYKGARIHFREVPEELKWMTYCQRQPSKDFGWENSFNCMNLETGEVIMQDSDLCVWPAWTQDPMLRAVHLANWKKQQKKTGQKKRVR